MGFTNEHILFHRIGEQGGVVKQRLAHCVSILCIQVCILFLLLNL